MNREVKPLKVSIRSFGCQMNVYDSEVASGLLESAGMKVIIESEPLTLPSPPGGEGRGKGDADVYLMNTCSVREHAEDKVYSRLGMLSKIKKTKPEMIIGLMGCMVEEHREKLFKRFPQLDLMVGTRNIKELPALIEEVKQNRRQVARIKQDGISIEYTDQIKQTGKFHAWLPIMTGCDKVCTYCIVPITRGSEVSMPAREVYKEASRLVEEGVQWITLLGQNVNSYNGTSNAVIAMSSPNALIGDPLSLDSRQIHSGMTKNEIASVPLGTLPRNDVNFPKLLEMLCEIEGLERISFTTSHPHDATEKLFQVIKRQPKISRRFHLPLQSGSNRILKRMKRFHTYEEYKAKIDRLRELVPDISMTTDIIAGFSSETEEDHQATMRALSEIRYDGAYIYKYSLRPATPAAKLPDDVPLEIKGRRNHDLLKLQKTITVENSRNMLGRKVNLFVEEKSTKTPGSMIGRTDQDKKVVFPADDESLIGQFISVKLTELRHETFIGQSV